MPHKNFAHLVQIDSSCSTLSASKLCKDEFILMTTTGRQLVSFIYMARRVPKWQKHLNDKPIDDMATFAKEEQ